MKTIGRNAPCVCGSGKKYKKCCINSNGSPRPIASGYEEYVAVNYNKPSPNDSLALLTTTTGELFMHARLYYNVYNQSELLNTLSKFHCIDLYDKKEFLINYTHETQNIGLEVKYNKVPKNLRPIILAKGKFIDKSIMIIDLRSFERASGVIKFLDKYISRDCAEITHIATHNMLHQVTRDTAANVMKIDYDALFSEENMYYPDKDVDELMENANNNDYTENNQKLLTDFFENGKNAQPVLVERFPVHLYEDGLSSIKFALNIRQRLAYEHMQGDKSLNMFQLIEKIIEKSYR